MQWNKAGRFTAANTTNQHKIFDGRRGIMASKLDEMFRQLIGRSPRVGEPDHPFYLALLRWFGASEKAFSQQRLDASAALVSFAYIKDEKGVFYFGGDQNWFGEDLPEGTQSIETVSGCGVVSAANILVSLAYGNEMLAQKMGVKFYYDGTVSKADMVAFMRRAYRRMGSLELPLLAYLYKKNKYHYDEKQQKNTERMRNKKRPHRLIPPSLGVWPGRYMRGTLDLASDYGVYLRCRSLLAQFCGYDEGLGFLRRALYAGQCVDIFTGFNGHAMALYPNQRDPFAAKPEWKTNKHHHVVAVGLIENTSSGHPDVLVSTWGKLALIPYDQLHASWQGKNAILSGMFYFEIADRQQMRVDRRVSRFFLWRSLGRWIKGATERMVIKLRRKKTKNVYKKDRE
jgi:hypothetical protein